MASTVNKVFLLGNVGKDPEAVVNAEMMIVKFSLATQKKSKGEVVTQWHNCVAFGKVAEIIQQYVFKGSRVHVEGAIDYSQYQSEGVTRYVTKIIVNNVSLLSSANAKPSDAANESKSSEAYEPSNESENDIPF